jgi:serine/threonine protein kinase
MSGSDLVVQLREVSSGLAYLHGQKIVHGDIHGVCMP